MCLIQRLNPHLNSMDNVEILIGGVVVEKGHNAYASDVVDLALWALTQMHGGVNLAAYLQVMNGATVLGHYAVNAVPTFTNQTNVIVSYTIPNLDLVGETIDKLQLVSATVAGKVLAEYILSSAINKTTFIQVNVNWKLFAYGKP